MHDKHVVRRCASRVVSLVLLILAHWGYAFQVRFDYRRPPPAQTLPTALYSSSASDGIKNDCSFPDDLIAALDLVPVLFMVASYCGTYRGQQALYKVVGQDDATTRTGIRTTSSSAESRAVSGQRTSRKRQLYDAVIPTEVGSSEEESNNPLFGKENPTSTTCTAELSTRCITGKICPIASSAEEVADMYRMVVEATRFLEANGTARNHRFPPIYPMDATNGPFDLVGRNNKVTSDDDDFLQFATTRDDRWTLEHVMQADQVVAKLMSLYDWSTRSGDDDTAGSESVIKSLVVGTANADNNHGIDINRLTKVWSIIHDTVEIVRVRTLMDAWGQTTYQFRLRNQKFPILDILRDRCESLRDAILQSKGTSSKRREQELHDMEQELSRKELEIQAGLIQAIHSVRRVIDHGLDILAKIDVVFAKAAFGINTGADVTLMDAAISLNNGIGSVRIEKFVHPLLGRRNDASAVPIDLVLGEDYQALVISGSNGGGKSVAMKSFGLISVLAKLGIPIVADAIESIHYFDEILVSVGDYQNVERGESTYIAQLLRHSTLIDRVGSNNDKSYLVLLDELGTGTEEAPGGAIGQAIVEKLMATKSCLVVATTHSPILKTWSFHDDNIGSAAVLLQSTESGINEQWNKRPSYQLQYGCIGESYALGAASRCLSEEIVSRAAALLSTHNQVNTTTGITTNLSYNMAITKSLEKQVDLATERALEAEAMLHDTSIIQFAMISLANAYDRHLSRLEQRVEMCYQSLRKDNDADEVEATEHVLGKTLSELRIVRTTVKREQEKLRERGLKRLRDDDVLSIHQCVVVIDSSSPWNGNTGTVTTTDQLSDAQQLLLSPTDVVVVFSDAPWNDNHMNTFDIVNDISIMLRTEPVVLKRYQLAIWDYKNSWDNEKNVLDDKYASIADANRKLRGVLTKLQSVSTPTKRKIPVASSPTKSSQFTSSRERKSAKKKSKSK